MKSLDTIISVRGGDAMATTTIQIRMDEEIKRQTEAALKSMGLNMSTAVNVFCQVKIPIFIKIIPHRHHGEIPTFSEVIRMQIS